MLHEVKPGKAGEHQFKPSPDFVGGYHIGLIEFCMTVKPSWFHRYMVRLVLGWEWKDAA